MLHQGYCNVSIAPLRKDADDRSEMISQLLFGESCVILSKKENWLLVECSFDHYQGWVDTKMITPLKKNITSHFTSFELVHHMVYADMQIPIVLGSNLPAFDGLNFKIDNHKFIFQGLSLENNISNKENIRKIALKYLHAPYLWGGRSPFGIDCSGFTQMVFKFLSISLPRDAYQQAEVGEIVHFLEETRLGDLAFFGKEEKITHVGIILAKNEIIHASGKVRIDKIDHLGIYNSETQKYTHKLKTIRRIDY